MAERVEVSDVPRGQSSTYEWNRDGRQTRFQNKGEMVIYEGRISHADGV